MRKEQKRNTEVGSGRSERWKESICKNKYLAEHIQKNYRLPVGRLELLEDILEGIKAGNAGELTARIYEYGSMVKGQDLIARQMFLWLVAMAEEASCAEKKEKENSTLP